MQTPEYRVDTWNGFLACVAPFVTKPGKLFGRMGFRGQEKGARDWGLLASLARLFPKECSFGRAIRIEQLLLREFSQDGHRCLRAAEIPEDRNPLGWLMIMQQYGAPTRLLDWTASPYVGAYFAVRDASGDDGVLWIHDYEKLVAALHASGTTMDLGRITEVFTKEAQPSLQRPPGMCAVFVFKRPERMSAQQGFYMVCEDPRRAHDEVMNDLAVKAGVEPFLHKVIIKSTAKDEFLANLRMMNITSSSLFPGADGLGRHVTEWGRLLASDLAEMPVQEDADRTTGGPVQ